MPMSSSASLVSTSLASLLSLCSCICQVHHGKGACQGLVHGLYRCIASRSEGDCNRGVLLLYTA